MKPTEVLRKVAANVRLEFPPQVCGLSVFGWAGGWVAANVRLEFPPQVRVGLCGWVGG